MIKTDERRSFAYALVLALLAKYQSIFSFNYSVDDYHQTLHGLGSLSSSLIGQGRFGLLWLSNAFNAIGYEPGFSPLLSVSLSVFLTVWIGNAILRLWQVDMPDITRALCIFMIAGHPYTSEIVTFRGIAIYHVIAFAVAFAAMVLTRASVAGIIVPAFVLSAALSIYQVPIAMIAVFLVVDLVIRSLRRLLEGDGRVSEVIKDPIVRARIAVAVLGVILYAVWLTISTWGRAPDPRSVPLRVDAIPARIARAFELVWQHFVTGEAYANSLVPPLVLAIAWILVLLAIIVFAVRADSMRRALTGSLLIVAGFAVASVAMLGPTLAAKALMLPPRVLVQIGVVWAGAATIVVLVGQQRSMAIATGLLAVASFSFIAVSQHIFVDQARVNVRDHTVAMLILERLLELEDFPEVRRIAFIGTRLEEAPMATATRHYGMNHSAYAAHWAIAPMLTELSGMRLRSAGAAERERAAETCSTRPTWPAKEAVFVERQLAIVCLGTGKPGQ